MSILFRHPQSYTDALRETQTVPAALEQPYSSYVSLDSAEVWGKCERLLIACLITGDEKAAHLRLEGLIARFGASNERIKSLKGIYQEAVAESNRSLDGILRDYDSILSENPSDTIIAKRRITLLRHLDRPAEAIKALTDLLDSSPTDVEAWSELSELYYALSMFPQAIHCLEEVLLIAPNAWNIHARIGELLWLACSLVPAGAKAEGSRDVGLAQAIQRFCRSIELCNDYFRGYFGLNMVTDHLLNAAKDSKESVEGYGIPLKVLQELNERSNAKIQELARRKALSVDECAIASAEGLAVR